MKYTIEELHTQFTGKEVIATPNGFLLVNATVTQERRGVKGRWFPARPCGVSKFTTRLEHAWKVLTGAYDVLSWEVSDEIEER